MTNDPNKAAELRDKTSNPFEDASISSGSRGNSIDEDRPVASGSGSNPLGAPTDEMATSSPFRSASAAVDPFVHEDDDENPFKG